MVIKWGLRATTRTAVWFIGTLLIGGCVAEHYAVENDTAADAHSRAIELCKQGRLDYAWTFFQDAVGDNALHAGAWHSLGNLAIITGDFESAIRYHGLGKAADPNQVPPLALLHQNKEPCGGLSDTFFVSSFAKKRLFDQPNDTETQFDVHVSMGIQLEDSGLPDLAMRHFTKAAELRPERTELKLRNALMVPVVYENASHVISSRRQLETEVGRLLHQAATGTLRQLDRLDQLALPGTFYLVYQGFDDARLMRDIHAVYANLYPRLSPRVPASMAPNGRAQGGTAKIRVGFVSSYLRRHSIGKLFAGIIAKLPRKRFDVVVFSSTSRTDDVTQLATSDATVVPMPRGFLLSNRDMALQQELDVIVYTDIGMDTPTMMWASARLAPVQVVTWGHPVTTGLPHMDYFVSSDLYEEPAGMERYTEQMVRLSSLGFHFKDPSPDALPSPALSLSFLQKYGLPTDRPIISCPQFLPKFHPTFDTALASILAAVPTAVLVLVYPPGKTMWKNKLADRLDRVLNAPGRVIWLANVPPADFLSLLSHSHVCLDPHPFGGGVTTLEALSVCSPVVTLPSAQTVPTLAAGMLRAMGGEALRPLIAANEEEYVQTAVQLASNATWRAEVRREICDRKHVLYSSKKAVKEWAAFLKRAVA